jgi:hypothetical protein
LGGGGEGVARGEKARHRGGRTHGDGRRGRRRGMGGEGAVSEEGEMVRRTAILGRRAPRDGAVVAWWESMVGAGRGGGRIWELWFFLLICLAS